MLYLSVNMSHRCQLILPIILGPIRKTLLIDLINLVNSITVNGINRNLGNSFFSSGRKMQCLAAIYSEILQNLHTMITRIFYSRNYMTSNWSILTLSTCCIDMVITWYICPFCLWNRERVEWSSEGKRWWFFWISCILFAFALEKNNLIC